MTNEIYPDSVWLRLAAVAAAEHLEPGRLGQYAETFRLGGAGRAAAAFPDVQAHLATCQTCRAELDELLDLLRADAPVSPAAGAQRPREAEATGVLAGAWSAVGWLLAFPGRAPAGALALAGSSASAGAAQRGGPRGTLTDVPGTPWRLRRRAAPAGERWRVIARLADADDEPAPGIPLALSLPGEETPRRATTDADGLVRFEHVPADVLDTAGLLVGSTED